MGTNINPLTLEYSKCKHLVTDCWFTKLWERLEKYKFSIHLFIPVIPFPRERDQLITDIFFKLNCETEEHQSLNRCHLKWECLFLSDIVTAGGRQLEKHMLDPPEVSADHSNYTFPREEPTAKDWQIWRQFWESYSLSGLYLHQPLGK